MNNQIVMKMLTECNVELNHIRDLINVLGEHALSTPYVKKYAVIRASGSIGIGFKTIIADRVDKDSHQQLKNFVARKIRKSSANPKLEKIEELLNEFDENWQKQFKESIALSDKPTLKNALTKLVDTRNSFAHGGSAGLEINDTIIFFNHGCEVLRLLDESIHEGVEPPETAGVAGIPELD